MRIKCAITAEIAKAVTDHLNENQTSGKLEPEEKEV